MHPILFHLVMKSFNCVSRMFTGKFEVSSVFQGCSKEVLRVFSESFKGVSRRFQGRFKSVLRKFQGCFNEVSGNIKRVSRKFHRGFN